MRIVRYELDGRVGTGVLEGDVVRDGNLVARLDKVTLLAPCEPRTIVCVGSNYPCQVAEKGRPWPERPALFLKTPNSVIGPGYAHYVLGYTCANDVTAHDWRADGQWARAKSADTFCPLGPWIETEPPGAAELTTWCNGDRVTVEIDGVGALTNPVTTRTKETPR
ncbi:fumarylacetoacetate hydrolase family protein [Amycolatopsis lurida]